MFIFERWRRDCGAVRARGLVDQRFRVVHLPYVGRGNDPFGIQYLDRCFERYDTLRPGIENKQPDVIAFAIWFHRAGRSGDIAAGAKLATEILSELTVSATTCTYISEYIKSLDASETQSPHPGIPIFHDIVSSALTS